MTRPGLALNEAKTSIRRAREERFDFLGYTFGPHRFRKDGHWYLGASPSRKSIAHLNQKERVILNPGNVGAWPVVRDRLNALLRGWSSYFSYGTRLPAYRAADNYVYRRVVHFLRRRYKVSTRCTRRFSDAAVFGELGVLRLRHVHLGPPPCALGCIQSESRVREIRMHGSTSGVGKRSPLATAANLDSTKKCLKEAMVLRYCNRQINSFSDRMPYGNTLP
jgi:hypothetical protein